MLVNIPYMDGMGNPTPPVPTVGFPWEARIAGALGGRAAEQLVFGTGQVTTGAGGDLQQAGGDGAEVTVW